MKKSIILSVAAMMAVISVSAKELTFTATAPGQIAVGLEDAAEITALTVTGPVDASDLVYIGNKLFALTTLDLGKATIEAFDGDGSKIAGRGSYPAALVPQGVFAGLPLTKVVLPEQPGLVLDDASFAGTALKAFNIPANVDSIGNGVFAACTALTEVTLNGASRVGVSVFADCPALTVVNVGAATVIAPSEFRRCTALAKVDGSERLEEIMSQAFEGCVSLSEFEFGSELHVLGESAFAASGLKDASSLAQATSLEEIEPQVFASTPALETIVLPTTLRAIGDGALFGATGVGSIQLPDGTEEIGSHALNGMSGVSDLVLPATVIKVGDYAMAGMTGLANIDVRNLDAVPETGENVWYNVDPAAVNLTVTDANEQPFRSATQWQDFNFNVISAAAQNPADDIAAVKLQGRTDGNVVEVRAQGSDIASVTVYDTTGRMLATASPNAATATLSPGPAPQRVYIVSAVLADGSKATLKLAY